MNFKIFVFLLPLILSCEIEDREIIIKSITDANITIKWYYYSYITDISPEFVTVEKDGIKKQLFKGKRKLINVDVQGHNISIKYIKDENMANTEIIKETPIFKYNILIDSTGNYNELRPELRGILER